MKYVIMLLSLFCVHVYADTIEHYMNIVNNIPKMEMKADSNSQAWARSARNILALTGETIAETLIYANTTAKSNGNPLFCLPVGSELTANALNELIQQTYRELSDSANDKNKMSISQIALLGITKKYPCKTQAENSSNAVTASAAYIKDGPPPM